MLHCLSLQCLKCEDLVLLLCLCDPKNTKYLWVVYCWLDKTSTSSHEDFTLGDQHTLYIANMLSKYRHWLK